MKVWYQQKTFWAGAAAILSGLGGIVTGQMSPEAGLMLIFNGFIAIFLRKGVEAIKNGG